ncbi:MAG TPA: hypothetical protein VF240_06450 [Pyrinomonadaceae bacterium]
MRKLYNSALAAAFILSLAGGAAAQRTATVTEPQPAAAPTTPGQSVTTPKPPPAPASVKTKYEGGVVGYGKAEGTLNFDDVNRRLVFRDKKQGKEVFAVPYDVVHAAWTDSKSQRSTAGTVVSHIPYGGIPGMFMKSKTRYLILQYRDPETAASGLASFKFDNKELLASVLHTFGQKAGLTQRGEAFIRRTVPAAATNTTNNP